MTTTTHTPDLVGAVRALQEREATMILHIRRTLADTAGTADFEAVAKIADDLAYAQGEHAVYSDAIAFAERGNVVLRQFATTGPTTPISLGGVWASHAAGARDARRTLNRMLENGTY